MDLKAPKSLRLVYLLYDEFLLALTFKILFFKVLFLEGKTTGRDEKKIL